MKNYLLTIGWLYPTLMSTYGDRGNIIVLQKRCEWRGIKTEIVAVDQTVDDRKLKTIDLLFGGGSQDREQEIVMRDLRSKKGQVIKTAIENGLPALFVCGSPQLFGKYYEPAIGKRIEGLGIFDMISISPGADVPRCIGNIVAEVQWQNLYPPRRNSADAGEVLKLSYEGLTKNIVGFENHGGRTYLGKNAKPFAHVLSGFGNNGEDGTEGVVYNNAVGCYFHGPLLPKNPVIADFFIQRALEVKYSQNISLEQLDDTIEEKARQTMMKRLRVHD